MFINQEIIKNDVNGIVDAIRKNNDLIRDITNCAQKMTLHYAKKDISEDYDAAFYHILAEIPNDHIKRIVVSEVYAQLSNMVRHYIFDNYNELQKTKVIRNIAVVESRTNNDFINGFK